MDTEAITKLALLATDHNIEEAIEWLQRDQERTENEESLSKALKKKRLEQLGRALENLTIMRRNKQSQGT